MIYDLNEWLKRKVRKWLGLDESIMVSDLSVYDPTVIVVATSFGSGRVKIIKANFDSIVDYDMAVMDLQRRYGVRTDSHIRDVPPGLTRRYLR